MANQLSGRVQQISSSGDLITDIPRASMESLVGDAQVEIRFGDHFTQGVFLPDHNEPANTLIATLGESGFLEIGIVGVSLHEMLGIGTGQEVTVHW